MSLNKLSMEVLNEELYKWSARVNELEQDLDEAKAEYQALKDEWSARYFKQRTETAETRRARG